MYRYDEFDARFVAERVAQFRDQVARRLSGELTEDQFRPLRLMNGLYLQLHAYMLRVAIPYGTLSSRQMRKLAEIARTYDRGYGHFTTRQNIQYNWPELPQVPDILEHLASVEMHAIQTSGNCIRNVTSDQWAGVAPDEIEDPRPICELLRQWSSLHPEFSFLPRKFKIAVTGAPNDRAAVKVHDIGLRMHRNEAGEPSFEVIVGGGLGRTPFVGATVREWLPRNELLAYVEAIMRVYNRFGRRDNKFKARIKILVHELGKEEFTRLVEEEYAALETPPVTLDADELSRIAVYFAPPAYAVEASDGEAEYLLARATDPAFADWAKNNLAAHKVDGYAIVNVSLKPIGGIPGDATADQMDAVADIAERYSFSEIRVTHEQNLVLPHVRKGDLKAVFGELTAAGLATPNIGLVTDIISCPGLDYCSLATARSIPIAQRLSERFAELKRQHDIGPLKIKISGCINACGHHHVGHIGILGLEKKGQEFYQVTLGGSGDEQASIGEIVGRGFSSDEVIDAIEQIVDTYLARRSDGETFLQFYRRAGAEPFKEALYAAA
ncbi:MAG: nitrite/sulfite reductase [Hyphomicrobiales bacterium]|nr:nitrite/sulfite reductase [Hyphomicrobiales bacterium]